MDQVNIFSAFLFDRLSHFLLQSQLGSRRMYGNFQRHIGTASQRHKTSFYLNRGSLFLPFSPGDLPINHPPGTCIIFFKRFQPSRIDHAIGNQNLRFMDMSQSHIIKFPGNILVERNVLLISPVRQQNVISRFSIGVNPIIKPLSNLPVFVTQSINPCVNLFKIKYLRLLTEKTMHIFRPLHLPISGILPQIIMIPRHPHHLRFRNLRKQIIHLPQLAQKRLAME